MDEIPNDLKNMIISDLGSEVYPIRAAEWVFQYLKDHPDLCLELAGNHWRKYPGEKPEEDVKYVTAKYYVPMRFLNPMWNFDIFRGNDIMRINRHDDSHLLFMKIPIPPKEKK